VLTISGVSFLLGTDYSSTTAGAFSVSYSASTGLLTILPVSGATFTLANAQTLLCGITYNNTTHNPTVTPNRVISITVTDAGDDNIGGSNKSNSLVATSTISLTAVNDAPVVTAVTIAYTDTVIDDTFTNTIGTLTASDAETNRNDLRFALTGSSAVSYLSGGITYDLSKSNSYGVFYLRSITGDYLFEPNDSAIEARFANATESFSVTTTDNSSPTPATSSSATVTVNITGVDDTNLITLGTLNNFTEQTDMVVAPSAIISATRDGLTQLRVAIDNNMTGDTLSATVGSTGISASYNTTTGITHRYFQ
jgi:VCBS repeat-containing protein